MTDKFQVTKTITVRTSWVVKAEGFGDAIERYQNTKPIAITETDESLEVTRMNPVQVTAEMLGQNP
jgi:hypothetical protein